MSCGDLPAPVKVPLPLLDSYQYPVKYINHPCRSEDHPFMFQQNETWGGCQDTIRVMYYDKPCVYRFSYYKDDDKIVLNIDSDLYCDKNDAIGILELYCKVLQDDGWSVNNMWYELVKSNTKCVIAKKNQKEISVMFSDSPYEMEGYSFSMSFLTATL